MPRGPGKYDDIATDVRLATKAKSVIVVILDGDKGNGFSVQSEDPLVEIMLPSLLRVIADQIEDGMQRRRADG